MDEGFQPNSFSHKDLLAKQSKNLAQILNSKTLYSLACRVPIVTPFFSNTRNLRHATLSWSQHPISVQPLDSNSPTQECLTHKHTQIQALAHIRKCTTQLEKHHFSIALTREYNIGSKVDTHSFFLLLPHLHVFIYTYTHLQL